MRSSRAGKIITNIRNAQQVAAIYEELGKSGKANDPYILRYEAGDQLLVFFGARHSNNPTDAQWNELEKRWKAFVDHDNQQEIVLYEQGPLNTASFSKDEALRQNGESGLVVWMATQANVPSERPEPDQASQVVYLKSQGYNDADVMVYYLSRQMLQWVTRDYRNDADWQAYARKCVKSYGLLGCWEQPLVYDEVLAWFKKKAGKDLDPKNEGLIYSQSDPLQSKVSAASGEFRDTTLLKTISFHRKGGKDLFVVYGSGHAIALKPALEELVAA